jgi:hypothetical protein
LAGQPELFVAGLDPAVRRWFTARVLKYVRDTAPAPADPKAAVTEKLGVAKTLATGCDTALAALSKPPLWEGQTRIAAVRDLGVKVAYGAMGVHPAALLRTDRADYLLFIVKRRCFAVILMRDEVNSNAEFGYPESPLKSKINDAAKALWYGLGEPLTSGSDRRFPYVLDASVTSDRAEAVTKLFTQYREGAKWNWFDCAGAATIVQMAALVEAAADGDALVEALRTVGPRYFTIDHPLGSADLAGLGDLGVRLGSTPRLVAAAPAGDNVEVSVLFPGAVEPGMAARLVAPDDEQVVSIVDIPKIGNTFTGKIIILHLDRPAPAGSRLVPMHLPKYHMITDPDRTGLFEQVIIPIEELQIGDHLYAQNHPLYRDAVSGSWGGEHSIVLDAPAGDRAALKLSGHAIREATLQAAIDGGLLGDTNRWLEVLRYVVHMQVDLTPANPVLVNLAQIVGHEAIEADLREQYGQPGTATVQVTCRIYNHAGFTWQREFLPDGTPNGRSQDVWLMTFDGTVGTATVNQHDYFLALPHLTADNVLVWERRYSRLAYSPSTNPGRRREEQFVVLYRDDMRGAGLTSLSLYHVSGRDKRQGRRLLEYGDVDVPLLGLPGDRVLVTRPRVMVDDDGSYRAWLRQKGALPPSSSPPP